MELIKLRPFKPYLIRGVKRSKIELDVRMLRIIVLDALAVSHLFMRTDGQLFQDCGMRQKNESCGLMLHVSIKRILPSRVSKFH